MKKLIKTTRIDKRKIVGDIVRRYLPHRVNLLAQTEWKAEAIACSKLIKEFTVPFLMEMSAPQFKINSLYFFLTSRGRQYIIDEKARLKVIKSVGENTESNKDIELNLEPRQHIIINKPKNRLEFLKS